MPYRKHGATRALLCPRFKITNSIFGGGGVGGGRGCFRPLEAGLGLSSPDRSER